MTGAWERIAALELDVEGYELERLASSYRPSFTRVTTVVHLHGARPRGRGEDVTYATRTTTRCRRRGPVLPLAGRWTLETFSAHLGGARPVPRAAG